MQIRLNDILVSGDQNHWGNICSGLRVIEITEQGIRVRRVHYRYNGEEFFLSNQALDNSLWHVIEINHQLPLL